MKICTSSLSKASLIAIVCGYAVVGHPPRSAAFRCAEPDSQYVRVEKERVANGRHAVIFVHGIFGARDTWSNPATQAYWPDLMKADPAYDRFDIYRVDYESHLTSQAPIAQLENSMCKEFSDNFPAERYQTVQVIAHSLGGNVFRDFLLMLKTGQGHHALNPYRLLIFLSTPMKGGNAFLSTVGSLVAPATEQIRILKPLNQNDYLAAIDRFFDNMDQKHVDAGCPSLRIFAGYEGQTTWGFQVVSPDSATVRIPQDRQNKFERRDHYTIAKPERGSGDDVYDWVKQRMLDCVSENREVCPKPEHAGCAQQFGTGFRPPAGF